MKNHSKLIKLFLIPILIFVISFLIYKRIATNMNSLFYYDEMAWIGRGYYLDLLINKDFNNDHWQLNEVDGDPKLTSYIYGLTIFPSYIKEKKKENKDYDMFYFLIDNKISLFNYYDAVLINPIIKNKYEKYAQNKKLIGFNAINTDSKTFLYLIKKYGHELNGLINIIFKVRLASIFFLSLSAVIIYLISYISLNNSLLSLIISVLYGVNPLVIKYGSIVYSEPIFLFFLYLGILIIIKIFTDNNKKLFWLISFVFVVALTNQVKLNGILLLFIYISILFFKLIFIEKDRLNYIKKIFIEVFLIFHLTLFLYVLSNPSLYKNPFKNITFQYIFTYNISKGQQKLWPTQSLKTVGERFVYINSHLFDQTSSSRFLKGLFILGLISSIVSLIKTKKLIGDNLILISYFILYLSLMFSLMMVWNRYLIQIVFFIYYYSIRGLMFTFMIIKHCFLIPNYDINHHSNLQRT